MFCAFAFSSHRRFTHTRNNDDFQTVGSTLHKIKTRVAWRASVMNDGRTQRGHSLSCRRTLAAEVRASICVRKSQPCGDTTEFVSFISSMIQFLQYYLPKHSTFDTLTPTTCNAKGIGQESEQEPSSFCYLPIDYVQPQKDSFEKHIGFGLQQPSSS